MHQNIFNFRWEENEEPIPVKINVAPSEANIWEHCSMSGSKSACHRKGKQSP
jgi:hypothetical protein